MPSKLTFYARPNDRLLHSEHLAEKSAKQRDSEFTFTENPQLKSNFQHFTESRFTSVLSREFQLTPDSRNFCIFT